jgi:hypothetical protein
MGKFKAVAELQLILRRGYQITDNYMKNSIKIIYIIMLKVPFVKF